MAERIQLIAGQIASVVADTGSNLASHSKEIAIQHPVASVAVGTGAALAAAPWLLTIPALTMAGFGSPGIASASFAATVHSAIGNVATGSAFAILQSAATGGAGAAIVNGIVQGAGFSVAVGGAAMGYFAHQSSEDVKNEQGEEPVPGNKAGEGASEEVVKKD